MQIRGTSEDLHKEYKEARTDLPKSLLCKFMTQLGRFDELVSGVINIHKYLPAYSGGADPLFEDKLIARTIPEKPNSRLKKYRLTEKAEKW